jgi:tRNA(adenine34) deaminase
VTAELTLHDRAAFERAVELALQAEHEGNLPIGCVICRGKTIIAEGRNSIWAPEFAPHRHAEMAALESLSKNDRASPDDLILYTTLEPCLMCAGAISLYKIGRVLFGSVDPIGGAVAGVDQLPPFFARRRVHAEWVGPVMPEACDALYERTVALIRERDRQLDGGPVASRDQGGEP